MSKPKPELTIEIVSTVHPTVRYFVAAPTNAPAGKDMPVSTRIISELAHIEYVDVIRYGVLEVAVNDPSLWQDTEQDIISALVYELSWSGEDVFIMDQEHRSGAKKLRTMYSNAPAKNGAPTARLVTA